MQTKKHLSLWLIGLLFIIPVVSGCASKLSMRDTEKLANSPTSPVVGAVRKESFLTQFKKTEHYKAGAACDLCHHFDPDAQFTLSKSRWETCTQCHTDHSSSIVPGSILRHPQKEMIEGVPVGTDQAMPSFKYLNMAASFSCFDCHVVDNMNHNDFKVPSPFAPVLARPQCASCHTDPQAIVYKIKVQQQEIEGMLEVLRPTYENWTRILGTMDKNDPKVLAFNNGATYFTYVVADGSRGVHNFAYAKFLLQRCAEEWASLK